MRTGKSFGTRGNGDPYSVTGNHPDCFPSVFIRFTRTWNNDRFVGNVFFMPENNSPLAGLVLCMICLSIAGSIAAGAGYVTGGSTHMTAGMAISNPPANEHLGNNEEACIISCLKEGDDCDRYCSRLS